MWSTNLTYRLIGFKITPFASGSGAYLPDPENPDPSRFLVGLMVETSYPHVIGFDRCNPGFLGHIILSVSKLLGNDTCLV